MIAALICRSIIWVKMRGSIVMAPRWPHGVTTYLYIFLHCHFMARLWRANTSSIIYTYMSLYLYIYILISIDISWPAFGGPTFLVLYMYILSIHLYIYIFISIVIGWSAFGGPTALVLCMYSVQSPHGGAIAFNISGIRN